VKIYLNRADVKRGAQLAVVLLLILQLGAGPAAASSQQGVQQRLSLVENYLNSDSAYRIASGGNQQALKFLKKAEQFLQQGLEALKESKLDQAAELADQSLRAYKAATDAARGKRAGNHSAAIKALSAEIETYYQAFMAALQEKGPSMSGLLNQGQYHRLMKQAQTAEQEGDGSTAQNRLNQVKIMVINALTKIRSNETVVYSKEFRTPADEYRYENGRYAEYASLTQNMLSKEELDGPKLNMLKSLQQKAESMKSKAESSAAAGDFTGAIQHMEEALKKLVQGLQLLGLPVSM
jgi:hypothetical protein